MTAVSGVYFNVVMYFDEGINISKQFSESELAQFKKENLLKADKDVQIRCPGHAFAGQSIQQASIFTNWN